MKPYKVIFYKVLQTGYFVRYYLKITNNGTLCPNNGYFLLRHQLNKNKKVHKNEII